MKKGTVFILYDNESHDESVPLFAMVDIDMQVIKDLMKSQDDFAPFDVYDIQCLLTHNKYAIVDDSVVRFNVTDILDEVHNEST
jgi:hypothetical protein